VFKETGLDVIFALSDWVVVFKETGLDVIFALSDVI